MWPFWIRAECKHREVRHTGAWWKLGVFFSQAVNKPGSIFFITSFLKSGNYTDASAEYFYNFSATVTLSVHWKNSIFIFDCHLLPSTCHACNETLSWRKLQTTNVHVCKKYKTRMRVLSLRLIGWQVCMPVLTYFVIYKQIKCAETIITCATISEWCFYFGTSLYNNSTEWAEHIYF